MYKFVCIFLDYYSLEIRLTLSCYHGLHHKYQI